MKLKNLISKTVRIKNVPQNVPCYNCHPCLRLRLMELGLIEGQKIELSKHSNGLWLINILGENGVVFSTLALRDEELERLSIEEDNCVLTLS